MVTSKKLFFSQKMFVLGLGILLFGIVTIGVYILAQKSIQSAHQSSAQNYRNSYHLSNLDGQAAALIAAIDSPQSNLAELEVINNNLNDHLDILLAQNTAGSLVNSLRPLKASLQEFEDLYTQRQQAVASLTDSDGDALQQELSKAYGYLDEIFGNLKLASAQDALLELKVRHDQIIDTPDNVNLVYLEDHISRIISMLPLPENNREEADIVMIALNNYFLMAEQYVSAHEKLLFSNRGIREVGENLSSNLSTIKARTFSQAEALSRTSPGASSAFLVILIALIMLSVLGIMFLRGHLLRAFKDFDRELDHLDVAEGEDISLSTLPGEFGRIAEKLSTLQGARGYSYNTQQAELDELIAGVQKLSFLYTRYYDSKTIERVDYVDGYLGDLVLSLNDHLAAIGWLLNQSQDYSGDLKELSQRLAVQCKDLQNSDTAHRNDLITMAKALHVTFGSSKDLKLACEASLRELTNFESDSKSSETYLQSKGDASEDLNAAVSQFTSELTDLVRQNCDLQNLAKEVKNLAERSHIVTLNSAMFSEEEGEHTGVLQDDLQQLSNHAKDVNRRVADVVNTMSDYLSSISQAASSLLSSARQEAEIYKNLNSTLSSEKSVFIEMFGDVFEKLVAIDRNAEKQSALLAKVCQKVKATLRKADSRSKEASAQRDLIAMIQSTAAEMQSVLSEYQVNVSEASTKALTEHRHHEPNSKLDETYLVEEIDTEASDLDTHETTTV